MRVFPLTSAYMHIFCAWDKSLINVVRAFVNEKAKCDGSGGEVGFVVKLDIDALKYEAGLPRQCHVQQHYAINTCNKIPVFNMNFLKFHDYPADEDDDP